MRADFCYWCSVHRQCLRSKINKLIDYLISQIFLLVQIITFEAETPAGHPKYQKTRITASFPIKTSAKYYHLTVGAQGQVKWAKVVKKSSTYDVTNKNLLSPTKKIFSFFLSTCYKTGRIFWDFDRVGSVYWSREIPTQNHMCVSVFFSSEILKSSRVQKC